MKHVGRKLLLPVAAVALAGGTFAFLASSNVNAGFAGQGTGTIAGYNVSSVHYKFDATGNTPTQQAIYSVTFTLDNPATQVEAIINSPGTANPGPGGVGSNGGYYDYANCTPQNGANTVFTCTYGGTTNGAYDSGQAPFLESTSLVINAAS